MNLMLKFAMFSCAGLTALGMAGCKITECTENLPDGGTVKKENCLQLEPTIEYREQDERTGAQAWTTGRSVTIHNGNGSLEVALGSAGDERVQFAGTAFTRETDNAEGREKAKNRLIAIATPAFSGTDSLTLDAPGSGVDGYHLKVFLPPNFDAALTVRTDNGATTIHGADGTTSTTVTSNGIDATNLRRTVNLVAKVGKIVARGVPSGLGNVIRTDVGDVDVVLGAANLAITATSESGIVIFPAGWSTVSSDDGMRGSATLGDGTGALSVTSGLGKITFYAQ